MLGFVLAVFVTFFVIGNDELDFLSNVLNILFSSLDKVLRLISFNTETGELQVNGKMNLPFNKEYWMPENDQGRPEIETLVDSGPQLNDSDQLIIVEYQRPAMNENYEQLHVYGDNNNKLHETYIASLEW